MGKFSSVGREGKGVTDPRRLYSYSSSKVKDLLKENRLVCFWMEFMEDKAGFSVELEDESLEMVDMLRRIAAGWG